MLIESEMTPELLLTTLLAMLNDIAELRAMGERSRKLAHPDAATQIANVASQSDPGFEVLYSASLRFAPLLIERERPRFPDLGVRSQFQYFLSSRFFSSVPTNWKP